MKTDCYLPLVPPGLLPPPGCNILAYWGHVVQVLGLMQPLCDFFLYNAIWAFWSWFSGFSVASMMQAVANKARVTNEEKRKVAVKKKDNLIGDGDTQKETDNGASMMQVVANKSKEKCRVAVKKKDNLIDVGDNQREADEGASMTQGVAYKSKEKGKVAVKKKDNLFDQ